MRFVNWGGARDGVPDRRSRQETVAKKASGKSGPDTTPARQPGRWKRANAARNAQTERDYHFDTGLADIARARPTGQRPGNTPGTGLE